jgi:hypothetical protein
MLFSNSEALGGIDEPKVAAVGRGVEGKADPGVASGLGGKVVVPALTDLGPNVADMAERGGPSDEAERILGEWGLGEYGGRDPAFGEAR